jgi:hypothetical protein
MLSGFSSKTLKAEAQGSVHISTRYLSSGQVGVQCSLLLGSQNSLEVRTRTAHKDRACSCSVVAVLVPAACCCWPPLTITTSLYCCRIKVFSLATLLELLELWKGSMYMIVEVYLFFPIQIISFHLYKLLI